MSTAVSALPALAQCVGTEMMAVEDAAGVAKKVTSRSILADLVGQAAALSAMGFNMFCFNAGVTGVNDGSRDDAPLLRAAYAAAVAAGAKSMVLPRGVVYVYSRIIDAVYPFSYVVRVTVDDFTVVVPEGCLIIDKNSSDGGGLQTLDIFQFTGTRSGITGGGHFTHISPGVNNNFTCAAHITNPAQECFITNLSAYGLANQGSGVFDDSSDHGALLANLYVEKCFFGVSQQNSGGAIHSRGTLSGSIVVRDFQGDAISSGGLDIQCDTLTADNEGFGHDALDPGCLVLNGQFRNVNIVNLALIGSSTTATGGRGLHYAPYAFLVGGQINVVNAVIRNQPVAIWSDTSGLAGAPIINLNFDNLSISGCSVAHKRSGTFARLRIKKLAVDDFSSGFLCDVASSGDLYLDGVSVTNMRAGGKLFPTTNAPAAYIMQCDNLTSDAVNDAHFANSRPPISLLKRYQRVASAASVSATSDIDRLTTILTGTTNTALTPPTNPFDGQIWTWKLEGALTLTYAGATVAGGNPGAQLAGASKTLTYVAAIASWV